MSTQTPVLALKGVSKSFGAVQALEDVNFEVNSGEVVALVGDNGAGKSTLVKSIAGIHSVDSGEILFEGQPVKISGPTDAVSLGIATVYQDLALCDNLDVVQNLFLGQEELAHGRGRLHAPDRRDRDGAPLARAARHPCGHGHRHAGRGGHACREGSASRWPSHARCSATRRS